MASRLQQTSSFFDSVLNLIPPSYYYPNQGIDGEIEERERDKRGRLLKKKKKDKAALQAKFDPANYRTVVDIQRALQGADPVTAGNPLASAANTFAAVEASITKPVVNKGLGAAKKAKTTTPNSAPAPKPASQAAQGTKRKRETAAREEDADEEVVDADNEATQTSSTAADISAAATPAEVSASLTLQSLRERLHQRIAEMKGKRNPDGSEYEEKLAVKPKKTKAEKKEKDAAERPEKKLRTEEKTTANGKKSQQKAPVAAPPSDDEEDQEVDGDAGSEEVDEIGDASDEEVDVDEEGADSEGEDAGDNDDDQDEDEEAGPSSRRPQPQPAIDDEEPDFQFGDVKNVAPQKKKQGSWSNQDKMKKKNAKQMLRSVEKFEGKMQKIRTKDGDAKVEEILREKSINDALKKASGEKVRDNKKILKKSIKKKEKQKQKSARDWNSRLKKVKKEQSDRQTQRNDNIQKKKDEKKKQRAGFEGKGKFLN